MSNSSHRRRVPTPVGNGGRSIRLRRTASRCGFDKIRSKSTNHVFERSLSDSSLNRRRDGDGSCMRRSSPLSGLLTEDSGPIVYLPRIRSEVMASSPSLLGLSSLTSPFPTNQEENKREATKVVINVAVEGSPGPVRTMVKLSCNVEETIKLVVEKYCEEGRTPKLDKGAAYELHQSHFSIQCLEKREIIGEIGSRSFYLRKGANETGVSFAGISPARTSFIPSSHIIESCIAQIIGKILRRTRKLWNILIRDQRRQLDRGQADHSIFTFFPKEAPTHRIEDHLTFQSSAQLTKTRELRYTTPLRGTAILNWPISLT
ncbi:unnamed protein product [Eruca vesicaria subsp. sativa]|uniref:DUF7054 domain-containing protein n=1 Tax=Eruca vesicaria subsp. sativa TaxID=29727 RepID=A0ABC8J980_ERUVS|nr:unnamed protein product [Eruca vesicaria subsp. sativa]